MSKEEEDDKNATSMPPNGRAVAATVAALHDRYRMDAIMKSWWVGGLNIYVTRLILTPDSGPGGLLEAGGASSAAARRGG